MRFTLHPVPSVLLEGHLWRSEFRMFFCFGRPPFHWWLQEWETFKKLLTIQHQPIPRFFGESPCNSPKPWCFPGSWTRKILQDNEARCEVCLERQPRPVSFSSWESKVTTRKMPPTQKKSGRLFKGVSPKSREIVQPFFGTFFHNMGSSYYSCRAFCWTSRIPGSINSWWSNVPKDRWDR